MLFYYQVEDDKLGVKSIKYFKNHLVFYLFNGEVGIVNHDFIVEKQVQSAEKTLNQMDLNEQSEEKELENIVFEDSKEPAPVKDVEMKP